MNSHELMNEIDLVVRELVDNRNTGYAYAFGYTESMLSRLICKYVPKTKHKLFVQEIHESLELIKKDDKAD